MPTWEHIRLCVIYHDGVGIVGFSKGMSPLTYVMDNNHWHQCLRFHICIFNVKPPIPYGKPRCLRQCGGSHSWKYKFKHKYWIFHSADIKISPVLIPGIQGKTPNTITSCLHVYYKNGGVVYILPGVLGVESAKGYIHEHLVHTIKYVGLYTLLYIFSNAVNLLT